MLGRHLTRTRIGLVLAVTAGAVLGATLGQPGSGWAAASSAKPTPKTLPTITGTAEVGITLVATHGTWTNKPTSFKYSWSRCATNGGACSTIGGATVRTYTPTTGDIGHTLRVVVTARNASGSTTAVSKETSVVPPEGCPPGTGAIPTASLTPPARHLERSAHAAPEPRDADDQAPLHGHGLREPSCAGRIRRCNRDPVQPVRGRAGHDGRERHHRADRDPTRRFSRQPAAAPAGGLRPGLEARRTAHQRHLVQPGGRLPLRPPPLGVDLGGARQQLVDLGRAEPVPAARAARSPRQAQRLEHPGEKRNPVSKQREQQPPGCERGRPCSSGGVLPGGRRDDDERERDAARHGLQERWASLQGVADRDEGSCSRSRDGEKSQPERQPAESHGPGHQRSRREHQGQESRTHA